MLTVEMLNNRHMLLLQPHEMIWRELLFYHLDIAKATCLSIRMHNGMFHIYSGEKEYLFPIQVQLHLFPLQCIS